MLRPSCGAHPTGTDGNMPEAAACCGDAPVTKPPTKSLMGWPNSCSISWGLYSPSAHLFKRQADIIFRNGGQPGPGGQVIFAFRLLDPALEAALLAEFM